MAGQGEVGHGGGPAGDLYVEIATEPHPVFTREGNNLHVELSVPMVDAALGTTVTLDSLTGEELAIEVPAGTQPGATARLSGKGMPAVNSSAVGDVVGHITVTVPQNLDHRTKETLEKLRKHSKESATVVERDQGGFFDRMRHRFRR